MTTGHRETQVFTLLWVLLPLTNAVIGLAMRATGDAGAATGIAVLLVVSAIVLVLFGRLVIEVDDDRLRWCFGHLGWPAASVALADIDRVESLKRAGRAGAGLRGTARDRQVSASIGGPALRLHLRGGRTLTLGTADPERLHRAIDTHRHARPAGR